MSSVAVDATDRVFVLHRGEPPLVRFAKDGTFEKAFGKGLFKVAHGLRIDRDGNVWTTDNGNHVLRKFSPDGELLQTFGKEGKAAGGKDGFRAPDDLVFDREGRIYVADSGNKRVQVFGPEGNHLADWGGFGNPFGLIVIGDQLLASEGDIHKIFHLDRDGKIVSEWGDEKTLQLPHLMAADSAGRLYVAEVKGKRVQIFQPLKQTP